MKRILKSKLLTVTYINEKLRISCFLVTIVFFDLLLLGCALKDNTMNQPVTKIVYSFKDASVPPQYHRSFTITVTRDQSHIIIDSYGDILADETMNIPEESIDDLAKYIKTYQIQQKNEDIDTSLCIGGTSKSLTVYSDKNILLDGIVYKCGKRLEGNLSGDIDSFTKRLESLIPDFTNLLK